MRFEFLNHGLDIPYLAQQLIRRKVHKVERMFSAHKPEVTSLHADLSYCIPLRNE